MDPCINGILAGTIEPVPGETSGVGHMKVEFDDAEKKCKTQFAENHEVKANLKKKIMNVFGQLNERLMEQEQC
ncbi:hypothetical protein IWQ61_010722, partial [Dispira simplex]